MSLKAKLKIILKANDTVVAESENSTLWQEVLIAINSPEKDAPVLEGGVKAKAESVLIGKQDLGGKSSISKFAGELNIDVKELEGACGPIETAPYIHLDKHHWEAFKKNTPERGVTAISAVALAATLLILWKDCAGLGETQLKETNAVLATIKVTSKNPTRSINNCEWLQIRNRQIMLNPARTSKAISVARAYCLMKKLTEE